MNAHKHLYRFKFRLRVGLFTRHWVLVFKCEHCKHVCKIAPGALWGSYI